jgi:predicted nucleic acid-binding protein
MREMKLVNFDAVTKLFENLRVEILPVEYKCNELVGFISGYFLLPNDALHVATMKRYSIPTHDPDFERVKWIKVWKP